MGLSERGHDELKQLVSLHFKSRPGKPGLLFQTCMSLRQPVTHHSSMDVSKFSETGNLLISESER